MYNKEAYLQSQVDLHRGRAASSDAGFWGAIAGAAELKRDVSELQAELDARLQAFDASISQQLASKSDRDAWKTLCLALVEELEDGSSVRRLSAPGAAASEARAQFLEQAHLTAEQVRIQNSLEKKGLRLTKEAIKNGQVLSRQLMLAYRGDLNGARQRRKG